MQRLNINQQNLDKFEYTILYCYIYKIEKEIHKRKNIDILINKIV